MERIYLFKREKATAAAEMSLLFLCPMTSGGMDDVDAGYNPAKWTYTVSYQKAGDGIVLKETKSRRSFRSLSGT